MKFQKTTILSPLKVVCFAPSHPPENSSLASYFSSKSLAFKTPHPPRNFQQPSVGGGGYGYFLEPHIINGAYAFIRSYQTKIEPVHLTLSYS